MCFFSYEHFYVIYIKFWNLDQDHDLIISQAELAKYDNNGGCAALILLMSVLTAVWRSVQAGLAAHLCRHRVSAMLRSPANDVPPVRLVHAGRRGLSLVSIGAT